ncbi:hypothetical protein EDD15DRAFT_2309165 [Pisolithus albus]|nr:hypothetical protein EDD15DRAFT_2309165 [Pisolithus albus]
MQRLVLPWHLLLVLLSVLFSVVQQTGLNFCTSAMWMPCRADSTISNPAGIPKSDANSTYLVSQDRAVSEHVKFHRTGLLSPFRHTIFLCRSVRSSRLRIAHCTAAPSSHVFIASPAGGGVILYYIECYGVIHGHFEA